MSNIKHIIQAKRELAWKEKQIKSPDIVDTPQECYEILKKYINNMPSDTKTLLEKAEPTRIDSHIEGLVIADISRGKIKENQYLVNLNVEYTDGVVLKSYLMGMLANTSKCYIRDLFGEHDQKIDKKDIASVTEAIFKN
jgi:predicted thioredoxin/glutaredoxin